MNRQQQRKVIKLTGREVEELKRMAMQKGVQGTLNIVYETMSKEFGFGEKRLDRLEQGLLKRLGAK